MCYLTCGPGLLIPSPVLSSPLLAAHMLLPPFSQCVRADLWTAREKTDALAQKHIPSCAQR